MEKTRVIINERVQGAMNVIMNGGHETAEWILLGHEKEHLVTFKDNTWEVDAEEQIKFLQMFIEICTKDLTSDEYWDYKQDCAANIRATTTLIKKIIATL